MKQMRLKWFCVAVCAVIGTASAQAEDDLYACTAIQEDAGREDAKMSAPLLRWSDGRLRKVEQGQVSYHNGLDPKKYKSKWIDLYAVPRGHGNTFLGSYLKTNFKCVKELE